MANTLEMHPLTDREIFYFRQRQKNRVFQSVIAYFADQVKVRGLSKRDVATLLNRDPAQITRWLSGPSNWTLDTISDLLLAMNAELEIKIIALDDDLVSNRNVITFDDAAGDHQPPGNEPAMIVCNW